MSEVRGRIIRKRNPGVLQSDAEVTAQFVVREHELATVLEVLRGNVDADSCQHTLIVAPRGRGKTMLLARVAAELRADAELASRLLPVRLMEESDEVFSAADFWLEVLFYLALAVDKQRPEFARSLRDTREDLTSRWGERELDERALAAVLEAADTLGKRLVLMVENLQALCANADSDFGWKLRKTLQMEPQIILVATATSRFEGLDDASEPFFELFRIVSLAPLNTAQCGRLWEVVSGEPTSEREIRPLEILTGGSPRFLVIVAGFARHHSLLRLMEELVRLIDDLTDTFRGDLQALPKTERRVFLAIADLWQPSTTGEIAARARMDVRPVSTMLGRLVEQRGAVVRTGTGRKRLYAVAERLYSIYYKLRRERDEAAIVQGLLHFMAAFYRAAELAGRRAAEPELQAEVATALFHRGMNQIRSGRADEALLAAGELDGRRHAAGHDVSASFNWMARYVRMSAELSQGNLVAAVECFCSLYTAFVPGNETMIPELVQAVSMLVTAGVPERELLGDATKRTAEGRTRRAADHSPASARRGDGACTDRSARSCGRRSQADRRNRSLSAVDAPGAALGIGVTGGAIAHASAGRTGRSESPRA